MKRIQLVDRLKPGERGAFAVLIVLIIIVLLLLAGTDWAHAAPAPAGRSVIVRVPAGHVLHVYPEAGRYVEDVSWRCTPTSRRQPTWAPAIDNGWQPSCRSVQLSAPFWFDYTVEAIGRRA